MLTYIQQIMNFNKVFVDINNKAVLLLNKSSYRLGHCTNGIFTKTFYVSFQVCVIFECVKSELNTVTHTL